MVKRLLLLFFVFVITSSAIAGEKRRWDEEGVYFPEPVVLVHGINTTHETWNVAKPELQKFFKHYWKGNDPKKSNTYVEAVNYGGKKGEESFQPVTESAKKLQEFIKLTRPRYKNHNVMLVCHSLGGLVAKQYLSGFSVYSNPGPGVRRLITMGTPHKGTGLANALTMMTEPGALAWIFGMHVITYQVMGIVERKRLGEEFWTNFFKYGRAYGKKGSIYTMHKNRKHAWDKKALPVPEAVFVYFPSDGVISVASQRGDGLDSLPAVVRIAGPVGVEHMQETAKTNMILKALDGIETFIPGNEYEDEWSDKPVLNVLVNLHSVERRRGQEYELGRDWEMVKKQQEVWLPDLMFDYASRPDLNLENEIPQFFLSRSGKMKVRYHGELLPRAMHKNEYLPASSKDLTDGTVVHVGVQRYASIAEIQKKFPFTTQIEKRVPVDKVEKTYGHGVYSDEFEIDNDESKPYIAIFTQAENPGGLSSKLVIGVFKTIPSIVSLVWAMNERQELFEGHFQEDYGTPIYVRQTEYAIKEGIAGKPDGGKNYPPEDAMDGVRALYDIVNFLRYDIAKLGKWFGMDPQPNGPLPWGFKSPSDDKGIKKDGPWTQIPAGKPGGPKYGNYLGHWAPVYPIHFEEIREALKNLTWIELKEAGSDHKRAEWTGGRDVRNPSEYHAVRADTFSQWQNMAPADPNPKWVWPQPTAGVEFKVSSSYDRDLVDFGLIRSRAAYWFKIPKEGIQREVAQAKLIMERGPVGNLSALRVAALSTWPPSYETDGQTLINISPEDKNYGSVVRMDLPLLQFKDYFLRFSVPLEIEQTNLLSERMPAYPKRANPNNDFEMIRRRLFWHTPRIWLLLKLKFDYPADESFTMAGDLNG